LYDYEYIDNMTTSMNSSINDRDYEFAIGSMVTIMIDNDYNFDDTDNYYDCFIYKNEHDNTDDCTYNHSFTTVQLQLRLGFLRTH
jgi:hypothetical protein